MFKNLSIKNKLLSLFIGIILFFAGLIFYSIKQMDSVAAVADKLANDRIPKVMALAEISKNVNIIARAARNMYIFREKSMVDEEKNTILKSREIIGQKFDYLKPIIKNPKGQEILTEAMQTRSEFIKAQDSFISAIERDDKDEAYNILIKDFRPIQLKYIGHLDKLLEFQATFAQNEANLSVGNIIEVTNRISWISILFGILVAYLGYTIVTSILNSIRNLEKNVNEIGKEGNFDTKIETDSTDEIGVFAGSFKEMMKGMKDMLADANMLSRAAVEGRLATRADATKYKGDMRKIVEGVNQTLDSVINPLNVAADYVEKISRGAIPAKITDTYNGDFNVLKNNINNAIDNVNALVADAGMLAKAAVEGKLATRADATKHQGDYRKIVEGVNQTLDSVINPLNVAADYVDKISRGAIPAKITDQYNGDFNVLKNNLNNAIDNVNALVADASMLAKAAVEGKLATRADATKHQGDYRKIVEGVNQTLDSVINPLNVAADYVDKISRGAIPAKITDTYNGDFNTIKNNLNNAIDNVNSLVADAGMLAKAAIEGKLATRADATKHQGDYRKIVEGVNQTLDSVIGPLNVAADYVDKISRGAIPAKITDTYNGDFNVLKNNLNNAIDNVNALVADAGMLAKAAVEGKLATRADATKHQGDYRKIVEGVNQTLDSVINPLNVAADYVDKISRGAIPEKITATYNGDFNTIKNNLNNAIDNVNALVADAGMLAKAAVEGKLATRADATKHQGDYRKIVEGVNQTLDSVIGPLNVAADYVDRIAKGNTPPIITDTYNGDFNTLKNNLNLAINAINQQAEAAVAISEGNLSVKVNVRSENDLLSKSLITVMQVLQALQKELLRLTEASKAGMLDERGKPEQFKGAYADVLIGVNTMLDAILIPIGEGNRVLRLIRGGNLRERVEIECRGDHQKMKDAVNGVICGLLIL
ncbi:MAG: MCP four helix bundle domain-containing protein [Leptospiraceae bacterium]|nr:MCP four helix bundle domain-containing protein [Leptospiraceae bacterium]